MSITYRNRSIDKVTVKHNGKEYNFDHNEPGYTPEALVALTLKKQIDDEGTLVPCALCKVTPVYFGFINNGPYLNPDNYICSDCYQKIID